MVDGRTLDVVIVSYRCRDLVRACLGSLPTSVCGRPVRVWLVDNASCDGTAELVHEQFAETELRVLDRNAGFAAATNLALREGDGDYVLVLNPDTAVPKGSLDRLVELMESRPEIGIAGCRLVRPDGSLDHAAKREFPTVVSALGHFTGVGRGDRARGRLAAYRAPQVEAGKVDAVNGAFMLIRRRALDEVGLFDEGYWMYMEDLDLCYRFARAHWITWYEPTVSVYHVKGGSSGRHRTPRLNYAFHYGMFRFYRKHYADDRTWILNAAVYLGIAVKLAVAVSRAAVMRRLDRAASRLRAPTGHSHAAAAAATPPLEPVTRRETPPPVQSR
jgi:N-acetylglucosaminyl-diphospho-decaprenol L-rhamnosyltransferase